MIFTIKNHLLVGVPYRLTPNIGGALKADTLIMHYTGSSNAAGSVAWLCDPRAKASAHIVIAENGGVTQLAPFNRQTWHAGISKWKKRIGMNKYAIGIEMSNPGLLNKLADGRYQERIGTKIWPPSNVVIAVHKNGGGVGPWAVYSPPQIETATQIALALVSFYGIKEVLGHDDIAPGRKIDPGPAFPMQSFASKVLGRTGV